MSKDVKMIGIGIGNEKTEIEAFKKSSKAAFPIFADEKFAVAEVVEVTMTPTMVIVGNDGKTLSTHLGPIKDFDAFLKELRGYYKTQ